MGGDERSIGIEPEDTPARSSAATRARLVEAGIDLVLDHFVRPKDPRLVFSFLTPGAVAERAGVSRGLIYHHWGAEVDGSEAFSRFLDAVSAELWQRSAVPEDLADLADLLPDNLSDVVSVLSEVEYERMAGDVSGLSRAVLALAVHGLSPGEHTQHTVDRLCGFYERVFVKLGLEPVPPLTTAEVAFALMVVMDGFTVSSLPMRHGLERTYDWRPAVEPTDPGQRWTLLAITIESIALRMTRPIGSIEAGAATEAAAQPDRAGG